MTKRPQKRSGRKSNLARRLIPGSARAPNYAQQIVEHGWVKAPSVLVAAAAGTITYVQTPTLSSLSNVAGFQALYDEYRITKINWLVQASGANSGSTLIYVDDEDINNPTSTTADRKGVIVMPNNNSNPSSTRIIRWKAQNLFDLEFVSTNTAATALWASIKMYTTTIGYGSGSSTAFLVSPMVYLQAKGKGGI